MFVGQYQFTLDVKKRLVVPAKFRPFFPSETEDRGIFATVKPVEHNQVVSNCLALYPPDAWEKYVGWITEAAKQREEAQWYLRKIASDTEFCKIDIQWRVVIPIRLINTAGLKREIMIIGTVDRIEVWDLAKWQEIAEWMKDRSINFERYIYGSGQLPETK